MLLLFYSTHAQLRAEICVSSHTESEHPHLQFSLTTISARSLTLRDPFFFSSGLKIILFCFFFFWSFHYLHCWQSAWYIIDAQQIVAIFVFGFQDLIWTYNVPSAPNDLLRLCHSWELLNHLILAKTLIGKKISHFRTSKKFIGNFPV